MSGQHGWRGNDFVFLNVKAVKKRGEDVDYAKALCDFYARGGSVTVCPAAGVGNALPHYDDEVQKRWQWGRGKRRAQQ